MELGAGTGMFATAIAERLPDSEVYAVDISQEMIDWMREHLQDDVRERVTPILAEARSLPLSDDSVDLVTMIDVHHEFDDPHAALREARRVLRAGGTVLIADWKPEPMPKGPPVEHRVSEETIRNDLTLAGLVDVTTHPGLPFHTLVTALKG